ncbi:MAG: hypothetical protein F4Z16_06600 [Rhodothermaceae bacterium]|nr:hypothetical protein [Rhodothermaceae bacterium]MYD66846.1 hypothetical protein [Rhodothermaceae bacterium]MYI78157.1 hypothetical protein [Gammaproteobacteria bacterium]
MNKKKTYDLEDFAIDEATIPRAQPVKLMDGRWGVLVSHKHVPELRNHLIVSVQTKGGKSWYAKLQDRVHTDKQGVSFSTTGRRIDLKIETEEGHHAYRERQIAIAKGKLFRSSNVVLPDQNEKLVQDSSKGRRSTRPRQRYLTRSR